MPTLSEVDRTIGAAAGIIMIRRGSSYEEALGLLARLGADRGILAVARDLLAGEERRQSRPADPTAVDPTPAGPTPAGPTPRGLPSAGPTPTGQVPPVEPAPPAQRHAGAADADPLPGRQALDDSVPARLLDLLVENTDLGELLSGVAELAVETVPGCACASITVIRHGEPATIAASQRRAEDIDRAQYEDGLGPCVEAAYTDVVVEVDDVSVAPASQWWRQVAIEAGVTAVLSLPIASAANIAAALNLYTTRPGGWPERTLVAGEAVATYTGDAITLAYRMTRRDPHGLYHWPQLQ